MSVDSAIELFKDWMRAKRPIYKTDIDGNANCMAKTLPLFQKFVFVAAYPGFQGERIQRMSQRQSAKGKHIN